MDTPNLINQNEYNSKILLHFFLISLLSFSFQELCKFVHSSPTNEDMSSNPLFWKW